MHTYIYIYIYIYIVHRIDVHASGDDGLEQDLDCCFVLLLHRQLNARVARLIIGGNFGACVQEDAQDLIASFGGGDVEARVPLLIRFVHGAALGDSCRHQVRLARRNCAKD